MKSIMTLVLLATLAGCGGGASVLPPEATTPTTPTRVPTVQEQQCNQAGWRSETLVVGGLPRGVLWKAPPGTWARGALVVMHGGGGQHANFCVANVSLIAAQVRFTDMALAQGFAVFLLDSSDRVTDTEGRLCGKVWDDEVRQRDNLDLPFIGQVLRQLIPAARPAGSQADVYLTGLSSGGYMAVRAATHFGDLITAFAPVASGDPYGWVRDCTPRAGDRTNVFGVGLDAETRRNISEPGACASTSWPNEKPWDGLVLAPKPPFRLFHHAQDGIHDRSCVEKVRQQLVLRGWPEAAPFTLDGGPRSADVHYWQDDYNATLLAWLAEQRRR
jgi:pimeloyl-ACP methyl ester carboxylesterase